MRLTIEFTFDKGGIEFPIHYNYYIQSFLYAHISPRLGRFLHDRGYTLGKRKFKMFTFSRLNGRHKINKGRIRFYPPVYLTISSPLDRFVSELGSTLLRKDDLELVKNKIYVESIRVHPEPDITDEIKIRMLSPAVVYSTLFTKDGRKKTYYYSPDENEFVELVDKNLRKKYEAFYGKKPVARKLQVETLVKPREHIITYRGTVIRGYMGKLRLNGNKKLLKLAYDSGIGSKNSQGFGMFEVI
ncbi:MAG: CRISPR-associated endoribonuclease Cas6 [Thermoplasmata archaeon]|nr:MAG: CRISPR-associated endoribonuclease Cas6 [Thermoplasmata archaeon]